MKKLHLLFTIIMFIVLCGFGYYVYTFNQDFQNEMLEHQQYVQSVKEKQQNINKQFLKEQQEKERIIQQKEISTKLKDEDGDGLTNVQEVALGTNDNEKDTDGDGIDDNIDRHPAGGGEIYKITVPWSHQGYNYTTQFGIPEDKYWYYKEYSRTGYNYQDGRFATPYEQTIQIIAKDITDVSKSTGDTCKQCIAIDFVLSMIYQYDIDYISKPDYPKFAIETIIDTKGDCEDTSFLMASILMALNYDVVLLLYSDHMAVGVWCNSCSGTFFNHNGRKYFFLETTGYEDNWEIGKIWGKYEKESPRIIDI